MKQDIDIDKLVSENRIDEVTAWLTEKIHKYGMLLTPAQLIEMPAERNSMQIITLNTSQKSIIKSMI